MHFSPVSLTALKNAWEETLDVNLTDQQWDSALSLVHASSICARYRLIQCKVLFRVHFTNARLARIYPSVSDAFNRCGLSPANHSHMFWSCPKLDQYWTYIFDTLTGAYGFATAPNFWHPSYYRIA